MNLRKLVRSFIITAVAVYLTTLIIPGFMVAPGLRHILLATLVFSLLNLFLRPLLKLLLLPINLITLGAFRWLINIILVYLWDYLSPDITITGFPLGNIMLGKFVVTILISFTISFTQSFILWVIK